MNQSSYSAPRRRAFAAFVVVLLIVVDTFAYSGNAAKMMADFVKTALFTPSIVHAHLGGGATGAESRGGAGGGVSGLGSSSRGSSSSSGTVGGRGGGGSAGRGSSSGTVGGRGGGGAAGRSSSSGSEGRSSSSGTVGGRGGGGAAGRSSSSGTTGGTVGGRGGGGALGRSSNSGEGGRGSSTGGSGGFGGSNSTTGGGDGGRSNTTGGGNGFGGSPEMGGRGTASSYGFNQRGGALGGSASGFGGSPEMGGRGTASSYGFNQRDGGPSLGSVTGGIQAGSLRGISAQEGDNSFGAGSSFVGIGPGQDELQSYAAAAGIDLNGFANAGVLGPSSFDVVTSPVGPMVNQGFNSPFSGPIGVEGLLAGRLSPATSVMTRPTEIREINNQVVSTGFRGFNRAETVNTIDVNVERGPTNVSANIGTIGPNNAGTLSPNPSLGDIALGGITEPNVNIDPNVGLIDITAPTLTDPGLAQALVDTPSSRVFTIDRSGRTFVNTAVFSPEINQVQTIGVRSNVPQTVTPASSLTPSDLSTPWSGPETPQVTVTARTPQARPDLPTDDLAALGREQQALQEAAGLGTLSGAPQVGPRGTPTPVGAGFIGSPEIASPAERSVATYGLTPTQITNARNQVSAGIALGSEILGGALNTIGAIADRTLGTPPNTANERVSEAFNVAQNIEGTQTPEAIAAAAQNRRNAELGITTPDIDIIAGPAVEAPQVAFTPRTPQARPEITPAAVEESVNNIASLSPSLQEQVTTVATQIGPVGIAPSGLVVGPSGFLESFTPSAPAAPAVDLAALGREQQALQEAAGLGTLSGAPQVGPRGTAVTSAPAQPNRTSGSYTELAFGPSVNVAQPSINHGVGYEALNNAIIDGRIARANEVAEVARAASLAANTTGVLRAGARGPEVEVVQRALNAMGANLEVDGIFGPETAREIENFQSGVGGVSIDGVIGNETRAEFGRIADENFREVVTTVQLARQSRAQSPEVERAAETFLSAANVPDSLTLGILNNATVRSAQQTLASLGYDVGPTGIDGDYGPATAAAVRDFQEANGLAVTGQINAETSATMREAAFDNFARTVASTRPALGPATIAGAPATAPAPEVLDALSAEIVNRVSPNAELGFDFMMTPEERLASALNPIGLALHEAQNLSFDAWAEQQLQDIEERNLRVAEQSLSAVQPGPTLAGPTQNAMPQFTAENTQGLFGGLITSDEEFAHISNTISELARPSFSPIGVPQGINPTGVFTLGIVNRLANQEQLAFKTYESITGSELTEADIDLAARVAVAEAGTEHGLAEVIGGMFERAEIRNLSLEEVISQRAQYEAYTNGSYLNIAPNDARLEAAKAEVRKAAAGHPTGTVMPGGFRATHFAAMEIVDTRVELGFVSPNTANWTTAMVNDPNSFTIGGHTFGNPDPNGIDHSFGSLAPSIESGTFGSGANSPTAGSFGSQQQTTAAPTISPSRPNETAAALSPSATQLGYAPTAMSAVDAEIMQALTGVEVLTPGPESIINNFTAISELVDITTAPVENENVITMANQNVTRNQALSPELEAVLNHAAAVAGIEGVVVYSGGQCANCPNRIGSVRHDHGMAADINLVHEGRTLNFEDPIDRARVSTFIEAAASAGATGIGAGSAYMGPTSLHVGFGTESVWGAGGASENAEGWAVEAFTRGRQNPVTTNAVAHAVHSLSVPNRETTIAATSYATTGFSYSAYQGSEQPSSQVTAFASSQNESPAPSETSPVGSTESGAFAPRNNSTTPAPVAQNSQNNMTAPRSEGTAGIMERIMANMREFLTPSPRSAPPQTDVEIDPWEGSAEERVESEWPRQ